MGLVFRIVFVICVLFCNCCSAIVFCKCRGSTIGIVLQWVFAIGVLQPIVAFEFMILNTCEVILVDYSPQVQLGIFITYDSYHLSFIIPSSM